MSKAWFDLNEASEYSGISVAKLRKLIYSGKLPCYHPQEVKKNFLKKADLDNLIESGLVKI